MPIPFDKSISKLNELELELMDEGNEPKPTAKTSGKKTLGVKIAAGSLLLVSAAALVIYFIMKEREKSESQAPLCQSNATGVIQVNYSQFSARGEQELALSSTFDCRALWCNEMELAVFLNVAMQVYHLMCSKINSLAERLRCVDDAGVIVKNQTLSVCNNPCLAWFAQPNSSQGIVYSQEGRNDNGTRGDVIILWTNETNPCI